MYFPCVFCARSGLTSYLFNDFQVEVKGGIERVKSSNRYKKYNWLSWFKKNMRGIVLVKSSQEKDVRALNSVLFKTLPRKKSGHYWPKSDWKKIRKAPGVFIGHSGCHLVSWIDRIPYQVSDRKRRFSREEKVCL